MEKAIKGEAFTALLNRLQEGLTEMQGLVSGKATYSAEEKQIVLDVLFTRDAIYKAYNDFDVNDKEAAAWFIRADVRIKSLDRWLKENAGLVSHAIELDQWRDQCGHNKESWWWNLKPPLSPADRYDWVWNFLTLVVLGLGASYIINIVQAMSVGNMTVASTFSTIAQLGGLAAISQGTLTNKGKERVEIIMQSLRVPSKYRGEVMLLLAFVLLCSAYQSHDWLRNHYGEEGASEYASGNLNNAQTAYLKGLEIDPKRAAFNSELGKIFESIGLQEAAREQYYIGVQSGDLQGINNLGRLLINRVNPVTEKNEPMLAQSFLYMGLQRCEGMECDRDLNLEYQLNRNLGWALLENGEYDEAGAYLKTAIILDEEIKEDQVGSGMAYCFLAKVYEAQGKETLALQFWNRCVECARPETIHEYRWFMTAGKAGLAYYIDTSEIVSGLDRNANQQRAVYNTFLESGR